MKKKRDSGKKSFFILPNDLYSTKLSIILTIKTSFLSLNLDIIRLSITFFRSNNKNYKALKLYIKYKSAVKIPKLLINTMNNIQVKSIKLPINNYNNKWTKVLKIPQLQWETLKMTSGMWSRKFSIYSFIILYMFK